MVNEDLLSDVDAVVPSDTTSPAPDAAGAGPSETSETTEQTVEVISVDELLGRLAEEEAQVEETPVVEETPEPSEPVPSEVVGMDTVLSRLETIEAQVNHPLLTTPFENYTVAEGLLLLALLAGFVIACFKLLKEGFSWL